MPTVDLVFAHGWHISRMAHRGQLTSSCTFLKPPYNWKLGYLCLLHCRASLDHYLHSILVADRHHLHPEHYPSWRHSHARVLIACDIHPRNHRTGGYPDLWALRRSSDALDRPAVGYAMQAFGVAAISNVAVTYSLDSYKPVTSEALVIIFVICNTIGMLLSLYAADWIERQGPAPVFGEMTAIQVASVLCAIPLYHWGRSLRAFTSRYGPMKRYQDA